MANNKFTALQSRFHNYSLDRKAVPIGIVQSLVKTMEDKGFPPGLSLAGTGIDLNAEEPGGG